MSDRNAPSPIASTRACPDSLDVGEARQLDLAVGGQALIEGVMMRSPRYLAMAVRTPDGRIVVRKKPFASIVRKLPFLNIPVLRGRGAPDRDHGPGHRRPDVLGRPGHQRGPGRGLASRRSRTRS